MKILIIRCISALLFLISIICFKKLEAEKKFIPSAKKYFGILFKDVIFRQKMILYNFIRLFKTEFHFYPLAKLRCFFYIPEFKYLNIKRSAPMI
jgi:hypothetical protein